MRYRPSGLVASAQEISGAYSLAGIVGDRRGDRAAEFGEHRLEFLGRFTP